MEFIMLKSKSDFEWYAKGLDVAGKYNHRHIGSPEKYPCKVVSIWADDPNGPYEYHHKFMYEQVVVCEHCGSTKKVWPDVDAEDLFL